MSTPTPQPARTFAADGALLPRALQRAGVAKADLIRVAGPSALAAMLWLCRHGYDQVGYLRAGAPVAADEADALLVAQTCSLEALDRLLEGGVRLREGGVLIVQTPEHQARRSAGAVRHLLRRRGFVVERCLQGRRREVHVARLRSRALRAAA